MTMPTTHGPTETAMMITYSYVEAGEQRSAEHACTSAQAIAAAVSHLDAIEHDGGYAYRAEETGSWYAVSADDMADLGAAVLAGRASAAYSLWCAERGEEIEDPTAPRDAPLTVETVTAQQIRALRTESVRAGDADMAAVCDRALSIEVADDDDAISERMHGRLRTMTERQAQQLCADAINRARAQEEV